jgi:hypothetical protein
MTLKHDNVREFYSSLPRPVRVGIEATGSMQWLVNLINGNRDMGDVPRKPGQSPSRTSRQALLASGQAGAT